jgi:hypothetical protein
MPHTPLVHEGAPLVEEQSLPQYPQLAVLFRLISQPLARVPSQFAHPVLHAILHMPPVQNGVPFVLLHTVLQEPQLVTLVEVLVSQPLMLLPSQLPQPAVQEDMTQLLFWHAGIELAKEHIVPQAPQFATLLEKSRQTPLQLGVNSPAHVPKPLPSVAQVRTPPLQSPTLMVSGDPV